MTLDKFKRRLKDFRKGVSIDPSQFNDPLALEVDWLPLAPGGANFKTKLLTKTNSYRYQFEPSVGALIFYWSFVLMGFGVTVWGYFSDESMATIICGAIFAILGAFMLTSQTKPIIFDKGKGLFWIGKSPPRSRLVKQSKKQKSANIPDIHALQILKEYCRGSNRSRGYYSYELNLVLKDASRIHVIDHGKYDSLKQDSETLAEFLRVPIWNGARQ